MYVPVPASLRVPEDGRLMNGSWSWRRSSFSDAAGNQCVEVARRPHDVMVRDSKDLSAGFLTFSATAWSRFTVSTDFAADSPASG
ncbi:DUF397 domain-containing protein [Streptomyces longwoodensis]|uniref:DUF397 domain-containing protein n=1 Tax=Streptomyces longwoodensis TaxID=68231 RepID=UPI0033F17705